MKKFIAMAATTAAVVLAGQAFAATSATTKDFIKNASIGDMFEIETSRVALERSTNPEVRKFAQQMVDDHSMNSKNFKATVADPSPIAVKLDPMHEKKLEALKGATGKDFDAKYIAAQNDAHDEAVSLYKSYSANGDDTGLKTFATKTLPVLEEHQTHARTLKAS